LGLVRFIDHSDGLKWTFGARVCMKNMHTDGVWCATAQIWAKYRGGPV